MNNKMNGLYKTAFILFLVCIVLLVVTIVIALVFLDRMWITILGLFGVLIATLGIIFATASKPKKQTLSDSSENVTKNDDEILLEKI